MRRTEAEKPLLKVKFEDKSQFVLPKDWEDVFVDYYGHNPSVYPSLSRRLKFVTGKYIEHQAWPSKFDGLQFQVDKDITGIEIGDEKYDDSEYYWEKWADWEAEGKVWGVPRRRVTPPPKWSEVAEAVMYFSMRSGLLQKYLQQLGADTIVVSAKKFLEELEDQQKK